MNTPQSIGEIVWSHSSLDTADKCLRTYYEQRVAKTAKQQETAALSKGNATHAYIEDHFKRRVDFDRMGIPGEILGELARFEWAFERYKGIAEHGAVEVEEAVGVTADRQPCGFWDKTVWGRGKIDLQIKLPYQRKVFVVDWKTGKVWPSRDQAERYAEFAFAANPWADSVIVQFAYVTANEIAPAYVFFRSERDSLLDKTKLTLHKILTSYRTGVWPENKNVGCRWCPVTNCNTRNRR